MSMAPDLAGLLDPTLCALLTQECQRGVIGERAALPELAAAAREQGLHRRVGELVVAARKAGVSVVHAVAVRRADNRAGNTNARLFSFATARMAGRQLEGSEDTRLIEEITPHDSDITTTRLHGLSPIAGTEVDSLLRNLGCRTVVIAGVSSNIAIPNAVFDAVNLGYQVVLPVDAIAGVPSHYTETIIAGSLSMIATTTTTDDITRLWGSYSP
jgi:nicotinamidase-related amidase